MSNKVFSGDFLKVLLALKESIMKDIHCSELAIIKEVYSNNCNCSLLSNPEIKINAYKTKGTICRVGDIVLVAFSDNDFRSNLLKKDNDSQLQVIDSPIKHQLDYGIIISNLTIGLGGTNVKFIDDAINTTNLSNLDLNRLSDQKLNELKDSGLLTENALYMTPDPDEDETKANVDGSNLTNENIASWANKLGCENVENIDIIYDKDSNDANINWGYTSGFKNISITGKDFSKYKILRAYFTKNENSNANILEVGIRRDISGNIIRSEATQDVDLITTGTNLRSLYIAVESNSSIAFNYIAGNSDYYRNENAYCYKIEGVY